MKKGMGLHPNGRTSKCERRGTVSGAFAMKGNGKGGSGWKGI